MIKSGELTLPHFFGTPKTPINIQNTFGKVDTCFFRLDVLYCICSERKATFFNNLWSHKMEKVITWLCNRAEMLGYIQDELDLYNDRATAPLLYEMTNTELQALCLKYGDETVKQTYELTDLTFED